MKGFLERWVVIGSDTYKAVQTFYKSMKECSSKVLDLEPAKRTPKRQAKAAAKAAIAKPVTPETIMFEEGKQKYSTSKWINALNRFFKANGLPKDVKKYSRIASVLLEAPTSMLKLKTSSRSTSI